MSFTPSRPSSFQLASDEVHSWCVSLDVPPETSARLYGTLTPDERTRSARFQFERDQQRFIVARGVLRDLLGRYLQVPPGQISFCGKGLAIPLNSFAVPPTTDPAHIPVDLYVGSKGVVPARRWSLYTLRPAPGYAGALAIEGTGWRLRHWQWKTPHGPDWIESTIAEQNKYGVKVQ